MGEEQPFRAWNNASIEKENMTQQEIPLKQKWYTNQCCSIPNWSDNIWKFCLPKTHSCWEGKAKENENMDKSWEEEECWKIEKE